LSIIRDTLPESYRVRKASLADADALVAHRIGMFTDMGVEMDVAVVKAAFRRWLFDALPNGVYRAWVVETADGTIAGGGGITVIPWPPGPQYPGDRLAFVYNFYTEPAHRRRGLGRMIMDAIHAWCRSAGVSSLALNASQSGRPLYEAMGYHESTSPMMFISLDPPDDDAGSPAEGDPPAGLAQRRRFR
jgi:GNAT superfamily N-acetyltransferase